MNGLSLRHRAKIHSKAISTYCWAALIGAALGFISLGWPVIRGDVDPTMEDRLVHVSGALYFIQGEWKWPVFHTSGMRYPEGASAALANVIPWFALVLKLLNWPVNTLVSGSGCVSVDRR